MITKVTIYGERCSGTNYLEELILSNFDVDITWEYGWKHFFGFNDLTNSDNTLFIGIIRSPHDWINSLYNNPHHLSKHLRQNINSFLNEEFYSIRDDETEIMEDRNMYSKQRYKDVFDMRYTKIKYLLEDMPILVKNYILITYDDLINKFNIIINKIQNKGLKIKKGNYRPIILTYYKKDKNRLYKTKNPDKYIISKKNIKDKLNMDYEKKLFTFLENYALEDEIH